MKKVIIWGMGNYYKGRINWLKDVEICAFINNDPNCKENYFQGKPIIRSEEIKKYRFDELIIAVGNEDKIHDDLKKLELDNFKIKRIYRKEEIKNLDPQRKIIKTFYCNQPNVGDYLNSFMMDVLYDVNIQLESQNQAEFVAIGSVLDFFLDKPDVAILNTRARTGMLSDTAVNVWGTGFMYDYKEENSFIRKMKIHALRGALTKAKVEKYIGQPIECPLADPGLLVSKLYPIQYEKRYEIGIIPHYKDYDEEAIRNFAQETSNALLIDITQQPNVVLEQIAQCETILSTSLHGLIMADSLGIPNQWGICSQNVAGDGFKFRDYYSAFGLDVLPLDMKINKITADEIKKNYKIDYRVIKKKQEELMQSFPYK